MKIGIIGAGSIGSTIARRLSRRGHDVKIANSRGPETIDAAALSTGADPVTAADAAHDVDVLIVSVPMNRNSDIAAHVKAAPEGALVIDTSNYYPVRDGAMQAFDDGQPESVWLSELFGRPVAKAWNAITSQSLDDKATEPGDPHRVAIPVAADDDAHRALAMSLVEETGFDAVDAGVLADSWRQQPGSPVYCTDRTREDMPHWLAAAEKERVPQRRDLVMTCIGDYIEAGGTVDGRFFVAINRACYS
ncbi:NAD(P)-binding domain-containing protein [Rhodococcus sp. MEB041]|uniref:NADPH-dependent F420 reductase n=1 Tax=Rhodococcus sp. MEB041 TaxID=3040323 RepID=UPI00254EDF05|nr:NAD(P)-binding domain-containing protein [Rhodococcus sp. MEB041]